MINNNKELKTTIQLQHEIIAKKQLKLEELEGKLKNLEKEIQLANEKIMLLENNEKEFNFYTFSNRISFNQRFCCSGSDKFKRPLHQL